ncbi:MAG: carbamate kinase [Nanoarchaeota archaeon]|nr:carbamate kinase [Nanoarchaeota archaeon]
MTLERIIVTALGGNQIAKSKTDMLPQQYAVTRETAEVLADIISEKPDHGYVITHGNGPQVGAEMDMAALAASSNPPFNYQQALHAAGAKTQGLIGHMILNPLNNLLEASNIGQRATALVTEVVVDFDDPGFQLPTKPVGTEHTWDEIEQIFHATAKRPNKPQKDVWEVDTPLGPLTFKEYEVDRYRQVVASPIPRDIREFGSITDLLEAGKIPIAVGGGGIPVYKDPSGAYIPKEAVIDKDRASALLVKMLSDKYQSTPIDFVILTATDKVYLDWKSEEEKGDGIQRMGIAAAKEYLEGPHFDEGSMKPKIQAAIYAIENGDADRVIITTPDKLQSALVGDAGTTIKKECATVFYR